MTFSLLSSRDDQPAPLPTSEAYGYRPDNHPLRGLKPDAATVSRLMGVVLVVQKTLSPNTDMNQRRK